MAIFNTDLQNRGPNQLAMLYSTQAFCTSFLKGIKNENFGSEFLTPPSQPIWKGDLQIGRNNLFFKPLTSAFVVICVKNCIKSMLSKNWKPILSMDIIILSACSECDFILIACSACVIRVHAQNALEIP